MRKWNELMVVGLCLLSGWLAVAFENMPAAHAAPLDNQPVVVLETRSVWRVFSELKPPVIEFNDGMKPVTSAYQWLDQETPGPEEGWTMREFPDGTWLRTTAQGGPHTPYAANLFLRARFEVTDPGQVKDLKLSVAYHGGVIVYLNGEEIARGNISDQIKGGKLATALAESYPTIAFVTANDEIVADNWTYKGPKEPLAARERRLTDVAIPAEALRKGVNLLAIEAIRAPYDKTVADYWKRHKDTREVGDPACPYDLNWNTCEVDEVRLTAAGSGGLIPNVSRPKELQAWNSDLLATDTYADLGDRCEPLRPVTVGGPRNGWSSGKVVIGSSKAITGLKVTCGDLKQGRAVIPAAAMRARYAVAFGDTNRTDTPLEELLEKPLDSFAVGPGGGAVVPIWLTVKVPVNAKPGMYTGQATVEVTGEQTLTVPISLEVADYAVPDTQDYRTWMELMQSPDTLAAEYNVPLWSGRHWELMKESMRYIGEIGSRVVYVPLIAQTNSGNSESMVRWIKKPDGTYDYDLSIMDKYLDLSEKTMGKPKFVVFTAWEIYLATPAKEVTNRDPNSEASWQAARWDLRGKGPAVTILDPKTGQTSLGYLPRFEDPASRKIWKPLFYELHRRMAQRGLEKNMLLGMASDYCPNKDEMAMLEDVSFNLPWVIHTHGGSHVDLTGKAKVAYTAYVWDTEYAKDPSPKGITEHAQALPLGLTPQQFSDGRTYGWKRPELNVEFRRFTALNDWPLTSILQFPEMEITGKQRGLGRVGADFWPVLKDKRGQRRGWIWDQYPQSKWHSCNIYSHMLDPGPDGPVATSRYEMMREGVQECEARIAIERVLTDSQGKSLLGPALAAQCQQLLDDRIWRELKAFSALELTGRMYASAKSTWYYGTGGEAGHAWYAGSGWQERAQQLYALAGEVQRKTGGK